MEKLVLKQLRWVYPKSLKETMAEQGLGTLARLLLAVARVTDSSTENPLSRGHCALPLASLPANSYSPFKAQCKCSLFYTDSLTTWPLDLSMCLFLSLPSHIVNLWGQESCLTHLWSLRAKHRACCGVSAKKGHAE